jgi:hypothetical protein
MVHKIMYSVQQLIMKINDDVSGLSLLIFFFEIKSCYLGQDGLLAQVIFASASKVAGAISMCYHTRLFTILYLFLIIVLECAPSTY